MSKNIIPIKCTITCNCMSLREAYYCPMRVLETNSLNNGGIVSSGGTRDYHIDSLTPYRIWEAENAYADMPPLSCPDCNLAQTLGGWLYERQFPTIALCNCQSIETMTHE